MTDVKSRYDQALERLVAKIQADRCVLAAVLLGSLAHDTVWERSDIDLLVVVQEANKQREGLCLVEDGVNIHAMIVPRSAFRKMLEGAVQGSFMHSMLHKGRLLFSRDEPLATLFEQRHQLADLDQSIQMLQRVQFVIASLAKAEKWYRVRHDPNYIAFWLLKAVDQLASVEVLRHRELPTREVVQQAIPLAPGLMAIVYTDIIENPPTADRLEAAIAAIDRYLREHVHMIFRPIFDYLEEEGGLRSMTEIDHHFSRHFSIESVGIACEWLADEGFLAKLAEPARLTLRSQVDVEEAAYCLPGGGR